MPLGTDCPVTCATFRGLRSNAKHGTVATIVTFHPDRSNLFQTVSAIAPDVLAVILFANSPIGADLQDALRTRAGGTPVVVIVPGDNVGLGAAYNAAFEVASQFHARYVLLLDQDSVPSPGMITKLETIAVHLETMGEQPGVIGPLPVTEDGVPFKIPRRGSGAHLFCPATPVEFAISSGSLISVHAVRSIGKFREDFFIDAIDIEWCLRAWHHGWSAWVVDSVPMVHALGQGIIAMPFGLRLTDQPPHRLYTYFRNQIAMLRLSHVPIKRKLRFAVYLPLKCAVYLIRNRFSPAVVRALGAGLTDGLRGRLGQPRAVWNWIGSRQTCAPEHPHSSALALPPERRENHRLRPRRENHRRSTAILKRSPW